MRPQIQLTHLPEDTAFAPLGVLGYCLTRTNFLAPVFTDLHLPLKVVDHSPTDKLLDVLVSILVGCRALVQVNTRLRPDLALAHAWGRACFADQSSLARTLTVFTPAHVAQLRHGSDTLFRRESHTFRHAFAQDWLWLDIDLTPLPASKHAEGSTKGKISGKKTRTGVNWRACMPRNTMKRSSPACTLATNTAVRPISPCSTASRRISTSRRPRRRARSCAPIPALGAMPM
jgi:hypothetical protein